MPIAKRPYTFRVRQGDTWSRTVGYQHRNGEAYGLSDPLMEIRTDPNNSAVLVVSVNQLGPEALSSINDDGTLSFTIPSTLTSQLDAETYWYGISVSVDGNPTVITTGRFIVDAGVVVPLPSSVSPSRFSEQRFTSTRSYSG